MFASPTSHLIPSFTLNNDMFYFSYHCQKNITQSNICVCFIICLQTPPPVFNNKESLLHPGNLAVSAHKMRIPKSFRDFLFDTERILYLPIFNVAQLSCPLVSEVIRTVSRWYVMLTVLFNITQCVFVGGLTERSIPKHLQRGSLGTSTHFEFTSTDAFWFEYFHFFSHFAWILTLIELFYKPTHNLVPRFPLSSFWNKSG